MKNKLVIISIDALQTQDLEVLRELPTFRKILEKASIVKNIKEVYPTLTNVNHVSIITGVTPAVHGIYHNQYPYVPEKDNNWNVVGYNWIWENSAIKVPTLIDAANEAGLVTAVAHWPTLGGTKPHYNFSEIWPYLFGSPKESYSACSSPEVIDKYFDKYVADFDFAKSFDVDQFVVPIASDMINDYHPDLLLTHLILLDGYRHKTGNNSEYVKKALNNMDRHLQKLINATIEAGTYENTNFIIIGDHGQIDIEQEFQLNIPFVEAGLISLDSDTANTMVKDYSAYSFSAGFSSQIILKDPTDKVILSKVQNLLMSLQEKYPEYIEKVYTVEEAAAEGLCGPFSFVVEGTKGTCFGLKYTGELITKSSDPNYHQYKSNHGYHPSKGPKPLMIAFGPDIKEGAIIENASVLNECATFCKLLGIQMPTAHQEVLDIIK